MYVVIRDIGYVLALREIFSKQAVGILVGASLPRLVWLREIEWQAIQEFCYIGMTGEFFASVRRYRQGFSSNKQVYHCPVDGLRVFLVSLATHKISALSVDKGYKAGFSLLANDGVSFPVTYF